MAQRKTFVTQTPAAGVIFGFLARHWPKLVNAVESRHIPSTIDSHADLLYDNSTIGGSFQNLASTSGSSPNRMGKQYTMLFQTAALSPETRETGP